jgi:hypothetical protein
MQTPLCQPSGEMPRPAANLQCRSSALEIREQFREQRFLQPIGSAPSPDVPVFVSRRDGRIVEWVDLVAHFKAR